MLACPPWPSWLKAKADNSAEASWKGLLSERVQDRAEFGFVENDPGLPNVLIYGDSVRYNKAAMQILENNPEIVVNDLYSLSLPNLVEWQRRPGDVHYNKTGSEAQGAAVAQIILEQLSDDSREN